MNDKRCVIANKRSWGCYAVPKGLLVFSLVVVLLAVVVVAVVAGAGAQETAGVDQVTDDAQQDEGAQEGQ